MHGIEPSVRPRCATQPDLRHAVQQHIRDAVDTPRRRPDRPNSDTGAKQVSSGFFICPIPAIPGLHVQVPYSACSRCLGPQNHQKQADLGLIRLWHGVCTRCSAGKEDGLERKETTASLHRGQAAGERLGRRRNRRVRPCTGSQKQHRWLELRKNPTTPQHVSRYNRRVPEDPAWPVLERSAKVLPTHGTAGQWCDNLKGDGPDETDRHHSDRDVPS